MRGRGDQARRAAYRRVGRSPPGRAELKDDPRPSPASHAGSAALRSGGRGFDRAYWAHRQFGAEARSRRRPAVPQGPTRDRPPRCGPRSHGRSRWVNGNQTPEDAPPNGSTSSRHTVAAFSRAGARERSGLAISGVSGMTERPSRVQPGCSGLRDVRPRTASSVWRANREAGDAETRPRRKLAKPARPLFGIFRGRLAAAAPERPFVAARARRAGRWNGGQGGRDPLRAGILGAVRGSLWHLPLRNWSE